MMLKVRVRDLIKFIEYVRSLGVDVVEGPHIVLTDSSEVSSWYLRLGTSNIGYIVAHYVDNHYLALHKLGDDATDREILEALIKADSEPKWAIPVEPVIVFLTNVSDKIRAFIKMLKEYKDEYPKANGDEILKEYLSNKNSVGILGDKLIK